MFIRNLEPRDEAAFMEMITAFYQSDAVDHPVSLTHAKRTFAELISGSPYLACLVAEDDNQVLCGFALLALTWSNESGGLVIWIEELFVAESARGKGLGRAMMETIHQRYPHATRFRLELTPGNERAGALYASMGYKPLNYDQMTLDFPPEAE